MRIMMSAAGSPVAHGIIRHLQSLGHYVIGHDCSGYGSADEFRGLGEDQGIADEFRVSPKIEDDPQKYLDFIDSLMPDVDVYLPFLDEELRLPDFNLIVGKNLISPAETLRVFTSKILQQKAMEDAGLPMAPRGLQRPYMCKPDHGRGGKQNILTELYEVAVVLSETGWLVQEFIEGAEYTVDVLTDRDGKGLFAVPRLRIQANGVSTIGKIVMDHDLVEVARAVIQKFQFVGPINIQMIREKGTGRIFIIEVNPRLSGSCMFTVMAGFDILNATIRMHMGLPFVPPDNVEEITVKRHYVEERL